MGLFNWFKPKSNVEIVCDRVWMTGEAKLRGIVAEANQALAELDRPNVVVLAAHFADCADALRTLVEQAGFDRQTVLVATVDDLTAQAPPVAESNPTQRIDVFAAERHPLASHDEALIVLLEQIPCRVRLTFHISLDDPLMRVFAGDRVKQVLGRLGMSEDEAIESRIVVRRILGAQKRFTRLCTSDLPAASAEEWLERNCTSMG
ncbi:MAG: hypothetical protein JW818_07035 [Pirellulales bacterium]|nr:hypothetical protein [Pirellulales bacterium]